nr:acylphosphatase [Ammoniphilus sp. YIM 78166]
MLVTGKVQGVGFRRFTQKQAVNLKIVGWVRNKLDGTVEIEAEGKPQNMNDFITLLWQGPLRAVVDQVQSQPIRGLKGYRRFVIKRNG